MSTPAYRRLLITSAIATFVVIVSGGIVRIAGSVPACPDWPLCYGQVVPPLRLDAWIEYAHRLLTLVVAVLIVAVSLVAWKRREADAWARRPPLLAPILLVVQIGLGAVIVWFNSPELVRMFHLGMAMSILACLIIPAVAVTVADEHSLAGTGASTRLGGRTALHMRRYRRLVVGTALAVALLVLTGVGVVGGAASSSASFHMSGLSGALATSHQGILLLVSLLVAGVLWSTWRARRQDRMLLYTALLAGGVLAIRASASIVGGNMLPSMPSVLNGLHLTLWSAMMVLSMLALRRPVPVAVTLPAGVAVGVAGGSTKQPSLINDYISLTKPKVIMLLLLTTLAAMFITDQGMPSLSLVFWTMLGGYLAAGGAGAINCAFDEDIDINMGRTSKRPVPSGRISPHNAFWFGMLLGVLSFSILATFTTLLAAGLALVGMVYYALFYTRWLKRSTWQNIVIGGGAGSLPPLVGWAAVTGTLTLPAAVLFLIIFYWTPPHFWALALVKQKDYARAGVPMLPVVAGEPETRWQILLYSVLMVGISLLLTPLQAMGWIYLVLAFALGVLFLRDAWHVWRKGDQASIWRLYKYSLLYLALLFAVMVLDRVVLG